MASVWVLVATGYFLVQGQMMNHTEAVDQPSKKACEEQAAQVEKAIKANPPENLQNFGAKCVEIPVKAVNLKDA